MLLVSSAAYGVPLTAFVAEESLDVAGADFGFSAVFFFLVLAGVADGDAGAVVGAVWVVPPAAAGSVSSSPPRMDSATAQMPQISARTNSSSGQERRLSEPSSPDSRER